MSARWLARAAFGLVLASAAVLIGFADLASLAMVAIGAAAACLIVAGGYWFLAHRGVLTAGEVAVDTDVPEIPVGIDGETVMMAVPVRCAIRPKALRVRVPRDRPGIRPPAPELDWARLRQLASFRALPAGTS